MTHCSTYTTPDLPPALGSRPAVCKRVNSNTYRPLTSSQLTRNIQLRLLPNHNPYSTTRRFSSNTLHWTARIQLPPIPHSMHSAAAAKSNPVFDTQLSLILHLCALPAWQHMLNAAQPSMNQHTVSSLHHRARTPAQRFLKHNTKYLPQRKTKHCSTYTTPDLPPTLAARPALCKGIHSNKYRPLKSSQPTPNIQPRFLPNHKQYSKASFLVRHFTLYYPHLASPNPPLNAQRCNCQIHSSL